MRPLALLTLLSTLAATACTGSESSVPAEAEKTVSYWSYQLKDQPESRIEVTIPFFPRHIDTCRNLERPVPLPVDSWVKLRSMRIS